MGALEIGKDVFQQEVSLHAYETIPYSLPAEKVNQGWRGYAENFRCLGNRQFLLAHGCIHGARQIVVLQPRESMVHATAVYDVVDQQ